MNDDSGKTSNCAMALKRYLHDDGVSAVTPISELNSSNNWSYETKPNTWKGKVILFFHRIRNEMYVCLSHCIHNLDYAPIKWKIAIISSISLFFLSVLTLVATYVFTNVIVFVPNYVNSNEVQIVSYTPSLQQTSRPLLIETLFTNNSSKFYPSSAVSSLEPTIHPSVLKSSNPTLYPTGYPTHKKSDYPFIHSTYQSNSSYIANFYRAKIDAIDPTQHPSKIILNESSLIPTRSPTFKPTHTPVLNPLNTPSKNDSIHPSFL